MDDKDRDALLRKARGRVDNLSNNDLYELEKIYRSGLPPWAQELDSIFQQAFRNDDAVLLKAKFRGSGSLSSNEKFRLDEAVTRRGRRQL